MEHIYLAAPKDLILPVAFMAVREVDGSNDRQREKRGQDEHASRPPHNIHQRRHQGNLHSCVQGNNYCLIRRNFFPVFTSLLFGYLLLFGNEWKDAKKIAQRATMSLLTEKDRFTNRQM
jgi:hypothetical protein